MTDETKKEAAAEAANDDANPEQANPAEATVEGVEPEQADPAPADAGETDVGIEVGLPEDDQIAELTAEVAALKDRLVRTYADLENTRKRAERDRQDALKFGATKFARDMCEVADNLRRALSSVPEDAGDANLVALTEGVKVTQAALSQIFERHGVKQIEAREQKFDPNLHEAMTEIEIPGAPPGTCVDVIEEGYTLNGRLLRPARVVVAKGNPVAGPTVDTSV